MGSVGVRRAPTRGGAGAWERACWTAVLLLGALEPSAVAVADSSLLELRQGAPKKITCPVLLATLVEVEPTWPRTLVAKHLHPLAVDTGKDDDGGRMGDILTDAVNDTGGPLERLRFIELQRRVAGLLRGRIRETMSDGERAAIEPLEAEARALLREHGTHWVRSYVAEHLFGEGYVVGLRLMETFFPIGERDRTQGIQRVDELFRVYPTLRRLELGSVVSDELRELFLSHPQFGRIRDLQLGSSLGPATMLALTAPSSAHLRGLELGACPAPTVLELARGAPFRLRAFSWKSPLRRLNIELCRAMARSAVFADVSDLRLSGPSGSVAFGDGALRALVASHQGPWKVRRLGLVSFRLTDAGLAQITGGAFPHLESLDLSGNPGLTRGEILLLIARLPTLRAVKVGDCGLSAADREAIEQELRTRREGAS